jgi:hypothetical protein
MKRLPVTAYRSARGMTIVTRAANGKFPEAGADAGIIAHFRRLDGEDGLVVHERTEDVEQEFEATGCGHGAANAFEKTPLPPRRGSGGFRPNTAPAYYLGRPASLWISATSPRRK